MTQEDYLEYNGAYGKGSLSMISYAPLLAIMKERRLPRGYLREIGLHPTTVAKIYKGLPVTIDSIDIICKKMVLRVEEVLKYEDFPCKTALSCDPKEIQ